MTTPSHILVIGGGISGLACAYRLRSMNLPVLLVERAPRFGGVIDAVEKDGFHFDVGPQSFLSTPQLESLIRELNLGGELLRAAPCAPRYILYHGKLVPAPLSPPALIGTPLFSARTKLRILGDALGRSQPPQGDESVAAFIRRKFGDDILDNLVAPFISGVYAGDPEWLSLPAAFPQLRKAEAQHGSVIRGVIKAARERVGPRPALSTLRRGLTSLIATLASSLGEFVKCGATVAMIRPTASGEPRGFHAAISTGGGIQPIFVSAIIVATPTDTAARLLGPIHPQIGDAFARIDYAPVAEIAAGYRIDAISEPTYREKGGFGFLIPRSEGVRSLGTVWTSALFPDRAPAGSASFTTFLGGATDRAITTCSDSELAAIAHKELAAILGISDQPIARHIARWNRALPQYNLGHADIVAELNRCCAEVPGLFLAGNYLTGPSVGACVEQAYRVTEDAAKFLRT